MEFQASMEVDKKTVFIDLAGDLDASAAPKFREIVEQAVPVEPEKLVLHMEHLQFMASAGLRVLIFARQKMGNVSIYAIGAQGPVLGTLKMSGFDKSVYILDNFTPGTN